MKLLTTFLCSCLCLTAAAAEPVDFVRDVRPILQKHCYACHGAKVQKSGLRLDVKAAAFKGGEIYGPSLVAGQAGESPLVQFVADPDAELKMPPKGDRLSAAEIATLTRWVDAGADWPDGVDLVKLADPLAHWSFQTLAAPVPPQTTDAAWPRGDIDRFVLAKLEASGWRAAPEADRTTWLRRVSLDLTGLPPTPEQVATFAADPGEGAYARVVDELLQSPRYGERWAQHWLDVVRYADTHGFEVNTERPHAWPYRDYVIRAFNDDVPYNRFLREQLVGDLLGADAATGFLVTASVLLPGQIGADDVSKRLARQDALDEIVVNISQTVLGLSIGCARCHDHKFDPIAQRDYYAMQAFVAGVEYQDRAVITPEVLAARQEADELQRRIAALDASLARFAPRAGSGVERPMLNARQNADRFAPVRTRRLRFTIQATNNLEPCLDELEVFNAAGENVALASAGTKVVSSGDNVSPDRHELRFVNDGLYGNSRSWMSNEVGRGWVELEFPAAVEIERVVWGRDREGKFSDRLATDYLIEAIDADGKRVKLADAADRAKFDPRAPAAPAPTLAGLSAEEARVAEPLFVEKTKLEARLRTATNPPLVFAGTFHTPDTIRLLTRGDPEQPKDEVPPAPPAALARLWEPAASPSAAPPPEQPTTPEQQRRLALAEWLTSPRNPLTARVFVNRVWQGHFGVGLVETASDFGHSGQPPSHPELLDWLAGEFVRHGWSLKRLHKEIVLSATYRQASVPPPNGAEADAAGPAALDAGVRLLWRYPSRRLDAETIRDSMLAVSGRLDLKMYGRGFDLFDKRGGLTGFNPVERFSGEGLRRMVYAHKVRRERDAVFGAFDCPDAGQGADRRRESTTPIQALNLFNSRFTLDQADAFAARAAADAGSDVAAQIDRVWRLALLRPPTDAERADALPLVDAHGLATLCRVLFNSNEFLFLP